MKDNKLIIVGNPITSTAQVLAEKLANTHSGEIIVVDKDDKSFKNVVPFEDIVNVYSYPGGMHGYASNLPEPVGYKGYDVVPVRSTPKILRNSPCPCGSGVKAKKCKCDKSKLNK
jgi:hypothetical protein